MDEHVGQACKLAHGREPSPLGLRLASEDTRQALRPGVSDDPPKVVTIASDGTLFLGSHPYTLEGLQGQFLELAAQNPKVKLAVRADKDAHWKTLVAVMDAAKAAKIKDISAFTKDASKQ